MKLLYAARMARYDLLRAICYLATRITKWTKHCDKLLHRLVCYVNGSLDVFLVGQVSQKSHELRLEIFADADFAGCPDTSRATSGVFLCLAGFDLSLEEKGGRDGGAGGVKTSAGKGSGEAAGGVKAAADRGGSETTAISGREALTSYSTRFPLAALSKRQGCVSHSTPEAEIVAADTALRTEGVPALDLWETITGKKIPLKFYEDNQAAIRVLETGRNPTMKHLSRTHKVDLRWIYETLKNDNVTMEYCISELQGGRYLHEGFLKRR
jgi:hypothetical protein